MHSSGGVFNYDLGLLVRCRQDKVRMVDSVFPSISHSDVERLKGRCVEEFADPRLHVSIVKQVTMIVTVANSAFGQRFPCQRLPDV